MFNDNGGRGGQAVYNALGLKAPEKIQKDIFKKGDIKELSLEVVPEYAADYMFVTDYNPNGDSKTLDKLKQSSIWKNLDAVKTIVSLSTTLTRSTHTIRSLSANRLI